MREQERGGGRYARSTGATRVMSHITAERNDRPGGAAPQGAGAAPTEQRRTHSDTTSSDPVPSATPSLDCQA